MTQTLLFQPVRDGYTFTPGYNTLESTLEGRFLAKRQQNKVLYAPHILNVNWVLSRVQYTQFMGFFRTNLQNGTLSFLTDFMVTDILVPTRHKCKSLQGMPKLTQVKALAYYVSCIVEAEANPTYTGLIRYEAPLKVIYSNSHPEFTSGFRAGDIIQVTDSAGIHPATGTALSFNGQFTVGSTTSTDTVTLQFGTAPWTTLAGLSPAVYGDSGNGDVTSTITRLPT